MTDKYYRPCSHCKPAGDIVKTVTVERIRPAYNSDRLDVLEFAEIGYQVVSQRDQFEVGAKLVFIPPECLLPIELGERIGVDQYLRKGVVRVVRLRGNYSEGLVVSPDLIKRSDYANILKWETATRPWSRQRNTRKFKSGWRGWFQRAWFWIKWKLGYGPQPFRMPEAHINKYFCKFYKMPNIKNSINHFQIGERVAYSEKIHGTNCRFGWLTNPKTGKPHFYVGSHNVVINNLKQDGNNGSPAVYEQVCGQYKEATKDFIDTVFYGEIYGTGIQHLQYDEKEPKLRVFAMTQEGRYHFPSVVKLLCESVNIPCVKFHNIEFESLYLMQCIAESPSEYTHSHVREGIVIVSRDNPGKMAKMISSKYLMTNNRTESH